MISFTVDTSSSRNMILTMKSLASLPSNLQGKIIKRVMKRAAQSMSKVAVSATTAQYYVKSGAVRKSITATSSGTESRLIIKGTRIGGEKFKYTPGRAGKKHSPLKIAIKKGNALTAIPGAFIAKKFGVMFQRHSNSRKLIDRLVRISVPQMIGHNEQTITLMQEAATRTFNERMKHEITYALMGR